MIQTGFETRVRVQDIVSSQLPNFLVDESPKTIDFLQQYYLSQEYQGGPIDLSSNLDQYLNLDNLTPEVVVDTTKTVGVSTSGDLVINVSSTKGFPKEYGLLKIDNEIISYTGITTNSFTGCIRGFSGITSYRTSSNNEELVFSKTSSESHTSNSSVKNLSSLFLKEFYKKFKTTFAPGLENNNFVSSLNVGNFLKEIQSFYRSKGANDSFRILFEILYGESPLIINLEEKLIKPSFAEYRRREVAIAKSISGEASFLKGRDLFKENSNITASISEILPFLIDGELFYKVLLFVGYDEESDIKGRFLPTPNSKCTENVAINESIVNVDSTIGFKNAGSFRVGSNIISYTDKNVNQFLNCTGINAPINQGDLVYDNEVYYGYENGDTSKKVELVFFTTISNFTQDGIVNVNENDPIGVKNLGDKVINPQGNKSAKQILANSWIYNTNSSYFIKSFDSATLELFSPTDKASLKVGDFVEIVERDTNKVIFPNSDSNPFVAINGQEIQSSTNITLDGGFTTTLLNDDFDYDIRKILNKSNIGSNSNVSFRYGNNTLISDIQNVYFDEEFAYVASNSLPSLEERNSSLDITATRAPDSEDINVKIKKIVIDLDDDINTQGILTSFNEETKKFDAIKILSDNGNSPFRTGEKIFYQPQGGDVIVGLETGSYFVEVSSEDGNDQIKLYGSNYLIGSNNNLPLSGSGTHTITLESQKSGIVGPQKLLKKFTINQKLIDGKKEKTIPGGIGLLKNGVEITNYKSRDKVYYGPLKNINVLNGGENFDVINPPKIVIDAGLGNTALAQPIVSGSIKDVLIDFDTFNYNIDKIISIGVKGGNGTGCVLEPSISNSFREVEFDARKKDSGGGINTVTNQIVFNVGHGFTGGQEVIYDSNFGIPPNIQPIGAGKSNLVDKSTYIVDVTNNISVKLFENRDDYESGNNPIEFLGTRGSGIHKLKVGPLNVLKDISVVDGGEGYTNKKLIVTPSKISTKYNWIQYENHGFGNGELIEYSIAPGDGQSSPTEISGLSTEKSYQVIKIDKDKFRLCDAGIGGTITSNFTRQEYVDLLSSGSGYQQFSYPEITVDFKFIASGVGQTAIQITPVVKGSITAVDLYEKGTGYGSSIINYENGPKVSIQNGQGARVVPIITNGRITSVNVEYGGVEYYSTPDVVVTDSSKSGSGAVLRAIVKDNKIDSIKVIKSGIGYSASDTNISVISSGINHFFESKVRDLTIINNEIFNSNKLLIDGYFGELKYSVCGYDVDTFSESSNKISGIIGWAYDGNPIYGPYGSKDPNQFASASRLISGYTKNSANVVNRPSTEDFKEGFFVEDYQYDGTNADLDEHNGRYEKNKEFPNGVYAYHAVVDTSTRNNAPLFPFFIGDTFRSRAIPENFQLDFNQSYDFNSLNIQRNTFPYNANEPFADNFFIKIKKGQEINVDKISAGNIKDTSVVSAGTDFKIGDILKFDNTGTNGSGFNVKVDSLKGREIVEIKTIKETYEDSVLTWGGNTLKVTLENEHDFKNGDYIALSGISTDSLKNLEKYHRIQVLDNSSSRCISTISAGSATTEIYVSFIPEYVSVGSTIGIGNEELKVLNVFNDSNILRVERGQSELSHPESALVRYTQKSFTIDAEVPYFKSKNKDVVYFNPEESVGFGTTSGTVFSTSFTFGKSTISRKIPVKGIYLENHPFQTNQLIKLTNALQGKNITYSDEPGGSSSNLVPGNYYAVNKSKNIIGIKTGLGSDFNEVYFKGFSGSGNFSNDDRYFFESVPDTVTSTVKYIESTVSVSTPHNLKNGDSIKLNIIPNLSVGIGTEDSSIVTKLDQETKHIIINPIDFSSADINITKNQITSRNHPFKTGDKVKYTSSQVADGLDVGGYFILKIDDDNIKLGKTYSDVTSPKPVIVDITGVGGNTHTLSLLNPEIKVTKNNNLTFDLSDSSLVGYEFKIYHDNDFKNEFVSTGIAGTSIFNVVSKGTNGSAGASLTVYSDNNSPISLAYNTEKSGYISTSDKDVKNYSTITFENSKYNGEFKISGIGATTFKIYLENDPERFLYLPSDCETLEYTTTSTSEKGGINSLNIISSGTAYKKLPSIVGSSSTIAENAIINLSSDNIGNINDIDIITDEFKYYTDITLKPTALLPTILEIQDANTIGSILVEDSGKYYLSPPALIIVDKVTGERLDTGFLEPVFTTGLTDVNIKLKPVGLPNNGVIIKSIFNTNGYTIDEIESEEGASSGTRFTCTLVTPINGFTEIPFKLGDLVYVEGIQKNGNNGDGFNSENYGYRFLEVKSVPNTNPFQVKFDVVGLTTNTGIAITEGNGLARLIPESHYPKFKVVFESSSFTVGEKLNVNEVEVDLEVVRSSDGELVVFGSDSERLKKGDKITGRGSLLSGKINGIKENKGFFDQDFSYKTNIGWEDSIGKLSLDHQVIADNDYYQNLSYSIRSNQTWKEIKSPVGRLVHTSGLKNFADTQIPSESSISIGSSNSSLSISDTIDESRVDVLRGIDLVRDDESDGVVSNFLQFLKTRFVNFVDCRTNNVLTIDNINKQFSNLESDPDLYLNIDVLPTIELYDNYLVRIESFNHDVKQLQFSEFILLSNGIDYTVFNKSELTNSGIAFTTFAEDRFGNYAVETETDTGFTFLRFVPDNSFDIDYDLKFITSKLDSSTGIGTKSIGFIDLIASGKTANAGATEVLFSKDKDLIESLHISSKVINTSTKEFNFVETYVTHDGTDTYISEYYVDLGGESLNNRIGLSQVSIDNNNLIYSYQNDTNNTIRVNSKIVGFGTTARGNGEYRYLVEGQDSGSERTAKYEAFYDDRVGIVTIISDSSKTIDAVKCNVEIISGSSKALHQITAMHDGTNAYLQQSQFLSDKYDSIIGLGTFSATYSSSYFKVEFHPEDLVGVTTVKSFNQVFYANIDEDNDPPQLIYGNAIEDVEFKFYNAINGDRINRKQFDLKHKGIDIFKKSFNPESTIIVSTANTGIGYSSFSVKNHFFRTGEELIYTPKSTFVGVGSTPMQYTTDGGIGTLESRVFAIYHDDNEFGIATTKAHAIAGIGITVTSFGEGNAHTLEMVKSNEKALISVDGITQYPILDTNITHTVYNNPSPGITTNQTIFALSGISSISVINILKVEDEYMRVDNVGIGTSSFGPISPGIGTFNIVSVQRGAVGSSATSHANGSIVKLLKGNYNIVDSKVNFIDSPRGNPQGEDENGLPFPRSVFNGRVYMRNDYSTNVIYDDISEQFTGITSEFTLTVGGANTTGIGTNGGQGVLFINGIFQTPETDNNPQQNYQLIETSDVTVTLSSNYAFTVGTAVTQFNNPSLFAVVTEEPVAGDVAFEIRSGSVITGIGNTLFADNVNTNVYPTNVTVDAELTTVKFTGVYVNDEERDYIDKSDVNSNQIPRGGLPITIGSTAGLGYAPLIGANLRPVVVGGVITDVVGVATAGSSFGIVAATYDRVTGILSITTNADHGLLYNQSEDEVTLNGLEFSPRGPRISGTIFPENGPRNYSVVRVPSERTFQINVGVSTIEHTYVGSGNVTQFFPDLSFGSGYNGIVSVAVTVTESGHSGTEAVITGSPVGFNTYRFISATSTSIDVVGTIRTIQPQSSDEGTPGTIYNPLTGILSVEAPSHGLSNGDLIRIEDNSLTFSCAQDSYQTLHEYPRSTDYISGISTEITVVNTDTFTVFVGKAPAHGGGALEFNILNGGSGYSNPQIFVSEPSYENLSVTGISRRGIGSTTDTGVGLKVDIIPSPSPDFTGIGSELFEVSNFIVSTPGYGFLPGDKFKPVGLVTSRFVKSLIKEFELEVVESFTDQFALWQFGEFDYMDSIKPLQNGKRTRFPLKYENELISVEANENFDVELNPILLIFRNRVIQEPEKTYEFIGGTSVNFKIPPRPEDDIHIFFYKGTDGVDSSVIDAPPKPIELGDELKVISSPVQGNRVVADFVLSDIIRTNSYRGPGITDEFKPVEVTRQKDDVVIDGELISKTRDLLESKINPTAKIIFDVNTTDKYVFVDTPGPFFNYENESNPSFHIRIASDSTIQTPAEIRATVSNTGTISNLTIVNGGSGYISAPTVKIQKPSVETGVGIGATALLTISNGSVNGFTIVEPGSGYSQSNPPQVIVDTPNVKFTEIITGIASIKGNTGIITGIENTTVGSDKAIKFTLNLDLKEERFNTADVFRANHPIFIYDTEVGDGVKSINGSDSNIVGIGTTFLDNIYIIDSFSFTGSRPNPVIGVLTCRVHSDTDVTSIPTTVGYTTDPIGKFSVGILTGVSAKRASNPISIGVSGLTIDSGLTTFPSVQRFGGDETLFKTGAITK